MKARRTLAVTLLGVIVAGAIGLGVAVPADAASKWTPGTSPKQFILNILGSVLAGASPGSKLGDLKQSVIAKDQVYDHSWEGLEQQWKSGAVGVPNTYQDYVLEKQTYFDAKGLTSKQGELTTAGNAKTYVNDKPKFPATKAATWVKRAAGTGAVIGAVAAWEHRADIANGVATLVGVDDSTGAICSNSDFLSKNGEQVAANFQNWVTGADCNAWAAAQSYVPNVDLSARPDGWSAYPIAWGSSCTYSDLGYGPCYAYFIPQDPQLPKSNGTTGTIAFIDPYGVQRPQGGMSLQYWCKGATNYTGSVGTFSGNGNFNTASPLFATYSCPAGATLYAALLYVSNVAQGYNSTVSPDSMLTQASYKKYAWFSASSPNFVPGLDPSTTPRTNVCTITGTDGQTYSASSDSYVEGKDDNPGVVFPTLPDGVGVSSLGCQQTGGGTSSDILPQTATTPEYQAWWGQYPECREGACSLQLVRKSDNLSCFDDAVVNSDHDCADWFTDPNKDADYQCTYGVHNVSLSECYVYSDVFKPDKVAAGAAWTDPATGLPTAGQSSPTAMKTAEQRAITDPSDYTGCLDTGWAAANPVEWVFVPIQCGMQWAFAPRQDVVTADLNTLKTSWTNTPFQQVPTVLANFGHVPIITGCTGVPVDINFTWPMVWAIHWTFAEACDAPLKDTATFVSTLLSALLYGGAAVGFSWYVGSSIGWRGFGSKDARR